MGKNSSIEWTDHTVNFWWGCLKVSPGCEHCYAETLSKRYGKHIWGPAKTTERMKTKGPWKDILKWDKEAKRDGVRRKVFVASMSDFFEDHPQLIEWRRDACAILEQLEWLDVQLLTKRPENIMRMVPDSWCEKWPAHVWGGASAENQEMAIKRIDYLADVPAKVRFFSCEPLLGPIALDRIGCFAFNGSVLRLPAIIDWVIVGGESGPHARPMQIEWARDLREQCQAAGCAFFMKQLGGTIDKRHNLSDFPEDLRIREFPESQAIV